MKTILVRVFPAALLAAVACGAHPPGGRSIDRSIAPDALSIPYGSGVTIDGDVNREEWAAAERVQFPFTNVYGNSVTATIWLLHDSVSLQVALTLDPWNEDVYYAPELYLDTDNDRSSTLQADDWWFHVSGSDCAASGRHSDYSTCTKNADWQTGPTPAERNQRNRSRMTEIRIPFAKLGISQGSVIGLGFRIMQYTPDTGASGGSKTGSVLWPLRASPDSPATWAAGYLVRRNSR